MLVGGYIGVIVCGEALVAYGNLYVGLGLHVGALCILLTHYVLRTGAAHEAAARPWDVLPALSLVPLLRIVGAGVPTTDTSLGYRIMLSAGLVLAAIGLAVRLTGIDWSDLGISVPSWSTQALIGLSGAALGSAGSLVVPPGTAPPGPWPEALVGLAALVLLAPAVEEVLFRGLIQHLLDGEPRFALLATGVLYASTYLASGPLTATLFVAGTGLYFGWCVLKTGSVVGVVIAHGVMNLGMLVLGPLALA